MMKIAAAWVCAALAAFGAAAQDATRNVTLVWAHSGKPAAGLRVAAFGDERTVMSDATSDAQGNVTLPAAARMLSTFDVEHARGGEAALSDAPVVKVPELVRFHFTAKSTTKPSSFTAAVGRGDRVTAASRYRIHNLDVADPHENAPWGFELPKNSARWTMVAVQNAGATSDWFPAADGMQLLLSDSDGGIALRDITVPPNVADGGTIELGTITTVAPTTLSVQLDVPEASELKLDAPLVYLTMANIRVAASRRDAAGLVMSMLDVVRPESFELVSTQKRVRLRNGTAKFVLPPIASADVYAWLGTNPPAVASKHITLQSGKPAQIRFARADFADIGSKGTGTFNGVVTLEDGGAPLAGATVVYSEAPVRLAATTDARGKFSIGPLPAGLPFGLLVTPPSGIAAGHVPSYVFRSLMVAASAAPAAAVTMPYPRDPAPAVATTLIRACKTSAPLKDLQYESCKGLRLIGTTFVEDVVVSCTWNESSAQGNVKVETPGVWKFTVWMYPFILGQGPQFEIKSDLYGKFTVRPDNTFVDPPATLTFWNSGKNLLTGLSVMFTTTVSTDTDPITLTTGKFAATISLGCINTPTVHVDVDTPYQKTPYRCTGDITFNSRGYAEVTVNTSGACTNR